MASRRERAGPTRSSQQEPTILVYGPRDDDTAPEDMLERLADIPGRFPGQDHHGRESQHNNPLPDPNRGGSAPAMWYTDAVDEDICIPDLPTGYDTRLIEIDPAGSDPNVIVCRSTEVALSQDTSESDALSHFWGPESDRMPTISLNGYQYPIRKELFAALKAVRDLWATEDPTPRPRKLWVDNLCIKQRGRHSGLDKQRQLNKMTVIYSHAARVIAWIGPRYNYFRDSRGQWYKKLEEDAETGLELLGKETLEERAFHSEDVKAVQTVALRPYWERCWIIQELCVSHQSFVLAGRKMVPFGRLVKNLLTFCKRATRHVPDSMRLHIQSLSSFAGQELQISREPRMPLIEALLLSRHSRASIEQDKVYAILSLSHDGTRLVETPNYAQTIDMTFWKLAHNMIRLQGHIAVILLARREQTTETRVPFSEHSRPGTPVDTPHSSGMTGEITSHTASHTSRRRPSAGDVQAFVSLPSWAAFWAELESEDNRLPPWVAESVLHIPQNPPDPISSSRTVLGLKGLYLEKVIALSGMPQNPNYFGAQPRQANQSHRPASHTTRPPRRSSSDKTVRVLGAVELVQRLWRAFLIAGQAPSRPFEAKSHEDIDKFSSTPLEFKSHEMNCPLKKCLGRRLKLFAVAYALMYGGGEIEAWRSPNRHMKIQGEDLHYWLSKCLEVPEVYSKEGQCGFAEEKQAICDGLAVMRQYKMRLALTDRLYFRPVFCAAKCLDQIWYVEGCTLPLVLRPSLGATFLEDATFTNDPESDEDLGRDTQEPTGWLAPPHRPASRMATPAVSRVQSPILGPTRIGALGPDTPTAVPLVPSVQRFSFVGEVYIHNHRSANAKEDQTWTGWGPKHFDRTNGNWKEFELE